jgi:hypothetical protein
MNTYTKIIIIIIIIVLIVLSYFLIKDTKKNNLPPYVKLTKDGFNGVKISELSQPKEFYSKNRNLTLNYLTAIYPTAKESLNSLDDLQLASFYNSLWFYFNCKGQYTDNDLGSLTGDNKDTKWGPLPCKDDYPLPYTPQGWLYNFYTYQKYNVPEVYSDSDDSKIYLKVENASSNRAGIMGTYKNKNIRSSGIMWVIQRSIQRDVWYPNGIFNKKSLDNSPDNWQVTVGQTPSYSYPEGWYSNLGDNQYIEVTHSPSNTGDALNMSPFWWYNVSVGSGLFLNLGKTLAVKNKVSGIFEQCKLLANTENGQQLLKKWYNSIDPYEITWGIVGLCGYNSITQQKYCDFSVQACGMACNPGPIGYSVAAGMKLNNFYIETLNYQSKVLKINLPYPTPDTIRIVVDLARNNQDYNLAHVAEQLLPDETNFFLGINLGLDTIQFYEDPNGNDNYVFELIDLRIPEKYKEAAKNRDYSGFMNIANPNASVWSVDALKNSYKETAINEYLQNAYNNNWLSIRDPFDIYNEDKVLKCQGIILSKVCNNDYAKTMYCSQLPLLNAYKCLALGNEFVNNTCVLSGDNPTC